ncbi:MAG TPA: LPS assembly lipoprotein LptE [Syntrophales bacterium]|nr:LPS assembly lipoprotein LptE [Syntrophales bacterium]
MIKLMKAYAWRRSLKAAAGVFLLVLPALGCGYRFAPAGEKIGQDIHTIYVGTFINNTAEANIETTFRNAFIDRFIKGRRFKIINDEALADALLKGNIKNLFMSHLAYRGDENTAVEKKITVTLSLSLTARDEKKVLWREENFSQWEDYAFDGRNSNAEQAGRKNALVKLANDTAEKAYRIMISDF